MKHNNQVAGAVIVELLGIGPRQFIASKRAGHQVVLEIVSLHCGKWFATCINRFRDVAHDVVFESFNVASYAFRGAISAIRRYQEVLCVERKDGGKLFATRIDYFGAIVGTVVFELGRQAFPGSLSVPVGSDWVLGRFAPSYSITVR